MIASVPRVTVPRVILAPPLFATTTLSTHDGGRKNGRWCGGEVVWCGTGKRRIVRSIPHSGD